MAVFRVVVTGRYLEPVDGDRAAQIFASLRQYIHDAGSLRDPESGEYEFVLPISTGETQGHAEALARAAVASSLFDAGLSRLTSTIDEIATRPLH